MMDKRLKAIEEYTHNETTLGEAAEIAGISIYELIEILGKDRIPYNLDVEAVLESVEKN